MAIYTKHDVRKMLYAEADRLKKVADDYVMGRQVSMIDIGRIQLGVRTGLAVIDGSWARGLDSEFPKRR
jgi:hypothetical protein